MREEVAITPMISYRCASCTVTSCCQAPSALRHWTPRLSWTEEQPKQIKPRKGKSCTSTIPAKAVPILYCALCALSDSTHPQLASRWRRSSGFQPLIAARLGTCDHHDIATYSAVPVTTGCVLVDYCRASSDNHGLQGFVSRQTLLHHLQGLVKLALMQKVHAERFTVMTDTAASVLTAAEHNLLKEIVSNITGHSTRIATAERMVEVGIRETVVQVGLWATGRTRTVC